MSNVDERRTGDAPVLLQPDTYPRREWLGSGVSAFVQSDGGWGLSNAGLVHTDEGVVLVDTLFTERRNLILREMILDITGSGPDFIINTHHHGDHLYGNGWFPGATVVSHVDTRSAVLRMDPMASARRFTTVDFGDMRPTAARLTFETRAQINLGNLTVEAFFPGVAHCVGNTAVLVPENGVLFAGDLLLKDCTPTFVGGSALAFLSVLEQLRKLDVEHVVPGHGELCCTEVIDETERYVQFVLEHAREALKHGRGPLEVARDLPLGEFRPWQDRERIIGNLYRAMHELAEDEVVVPMDMAAVWRDTETWLGRPVHSRA